MATLGSVALGARVVERHVTADKGLKGTDHRCSLDLEEFGRMVRDIRTMEAALGSGRKTRQPSEEACFAKLGKSLVYSRYNESSQTKFTSYGATLFFRMSVMGHPPRTSTQN